MSLMNYRNIATTSGIPYNLIPLFKWILKLKSLNLIFDLQSYFLGHISFYSMRNVISSSNYKKKLDSLPVTQAVPSNLTWLVNWTVDYLYSFLSKCLLVLPSLMELEECFCYFHFQSWPSYPKFLTNRKIILC